ncbi:MAG: type II toxin-antitoxin system HigB family toxin [Leadbetterella sp.]|nr:type II toxin-antitoxin system HigB family toxin [Leadbetterella sp.]
MVVISYKTLRDFGEQYRNSIDALNNWYSIMEKGDFPNFNELRTVFNSVDAVGNDRYVFNIKGNHYRLVALIHFRVRTVYVLFVGTHQQYDKIDASKIEYM